MNRSRPLKNSPLVSILIISFNQEKFIRQALESALGQDYKNLEVVISDDASTDGTQDIIQEVRQLFPHRLRVTINPTNQGITANSNLGLKQCKGELVAFMGGDDVLLPGKIVNQVEWFMQNDKRVLCGHDVEWIDTTGKSLNLKTSELIPMQQGRGAGGFIKNGTPFSAVSVMVRRDRIPEYGFHPALPTVSDWKLWIDVVGTQGVYGYIPGVWAYYRRHSDNVTARLSWQVVRDILLTAVLSVWHLRGKYLQYWLYYFLVRPLLKSPWRKLFA